MIDKRQREGLAKDFGAKRDEYFARNYAEETPQNYLRRLRRELIETEALRAPQSGHVLDIGCGPALLYPDLLDKAGKYYAVDLVQSNLDHVREQHSEDKVTCLQADLDTFDWEGPPCDIVVCSGAIEYTDRPHEVLCRLADNLAKNGVLVCSFPSRRSPHRLWSEYVYRRLSALKHLLCGKHRPDYRRTLFSPGRIAALFDQQMFGVTIRYFGYKFLLQPLDLLLPVVDHRLASRLQQGTHPRLETYCSEFLLVLRRNK